MFEWIKNDRIYIGTDIAVGGQPVENTHFWRERGERGFFHP